MNYAAFKTSYKTCKYIVVIILNRYASLSKFRVAGIEQIIHWRFNNED